MAFRIFSIDEKTLAKKSRAGISSLKNEVVPVHKTKLSRIAMLSGSNSGFVK